MNQLKQSDLKVSSLIAIVACLLTGCITQTWQLPVTPVTYAPSEKLPVRVQLVLGDEIQNAEWKALISPFGKARIQIGADLARNTENFARAAFTDVVVTTNATTPPLANVIAILIPKLVSFERTQPTTIFGDQTTSLVMEWRLKAVNGDILWVDTVTGQSTTKMGSNVKKSAGTQIQAAFDDLFAKSYRSLTLSPEVRKLAKKPGGN